VCIGLIGLGLRPAGCLGGERTIDPLLAGKLLESRNSTRVGFGVRHGRPGGSIDRSEKHNRRPQLIKSCSTKEKETRHNNSSSQNTISSTTMKALIKIAFAWGLGPWREKHQTTTRVADGGERARERRLLKICKSTLHFALAAPSSQPRPSSQTHPTDQLIQSCSPRSIGGVRSTRQGLCGCVPGASGFFPTRLVALRTEPCVVGRNPVATAAPERQAQSVD
jgi:hypothetical protein